jgi:hypothetical protein
MVCMVLIDDGYVSDATKASDMLMNDRFHHEYE